MKSWESKLEIPHIQKRKQMPTRYRNYQFATVLKDPVQFDKKLRLLINVLEYVQNSDRVERNIIKWQLGRIAYFDNLQLREKFMSLLNCLLRYINAD